MRERKFWTKEGRPWFYTKIDGKVTRLGPIDKGEAHSRRILERILKGEVKPDSSGFGPTFARLADQFLEHSQLTNDPETYEVHRLYLQSFVNHVGKRQVASLCEADLDKWCLKHARQAGTVKAGGKKGGTRKGTVWSENTQARAKAIVLAALNYGVKKLGMPDHPLKHVKPGSVGSRERYLEPEQRQTIREAVKGPFADYLFTLEKTGARPFSEIAKLTAADIDFEKGTAKLEKWKNSRKQKDRKRTIQLVPEVLQVIRKLAMKHREGPLFRNNIGSPWTRQALTARFRKLSETTGIEVTAYDLRAAYITDALAKGVPVAVIAELCGTSIQTIDKHYRRTDKMEDVLREAARKAVG